jgi:hypothetical protein
MRVHNFVLIRLLYFNFIPMPEKEIWKLLELLNEYNFQEYNVKRFFKEENVNNVMKAEWIISKRYWFIKWLVENDKINKSKVFSFIDTDGTYEDILCLLALSDEPIEDLISFLK